MLLHSLMDKCSWRHCGWTLTLQTSTHSQGPQSGVGLWVLLALYLDTHMPTFTCPVHFWCSCSRTTFGKVWGFVFHTLRGGPDPIFMLPSFAGLWLSRPQLSWVLRHPTPPPQPPLPAHTHTLVLYFRTQCSSRTSWAGGWGGRGEGMVPWPRDPWQARLSTQLSVCGGNKWTEWMGGAISGYQLHLCGCSSWPCRRLCSFLMTHPPPQVGPPCWLSIPRSASPLLLPGTLGLSFLSPRETGFGTQIYSHAKHIQFYLIIELI